MRIQEINNGYSEQPVKKPKVGKKKNKSKRKLRWLKLVIELIIMGACIVLLAISPLFNIREIEVYGSEHYNKEEIKNASGIVIGSNGFKAVGSDLRNIFTFRDGKAEINILKSCPYVKDVKAVFNITGVIKVKITERKPIGVIQYLGTNLLVDDQAYVIDTIPNGQKTGVPFLKGLSFNRFKLGQALKLSDKNAIDSAVALIEAIKKNDAENTAFDIKLIKSINYIDISDSEKVTVGVNTKLDVNFGNIQDLPYQDLTYRIDFLKTILSGNYKSGYIDLSSGKNVYGRDSK